MLTYKHEPMHQKINNLHMQNQRRRCFLYTDSIIPLLLHNSEISSPLPDLVTVQVDLCQTWLEAQIVVFLLPRLYYIIIIFSRWIRLLFGREFPMQDLLVLWDAIFADGIGFDLVDYIFVAMLLYIRDHCE